jgi:hypothetical protein
MHNDNGGNFNDTSDSSPESAGEGSDLDSVGSSANDAPMSARDFLSRRQEIRERKGNTAKETKAQPRANLAEGEGEEASEETDNSQLSKTDKVERKETREANPKFQQRIDKLTAKYHESERKAAQKDIQIEKLMKATEILQKELSRVAKVAKLDPREERIKELEYQQEVEKFTNSLSQKEDELYNKSVSEYAVQSRADEILDEVNELVQEYDLVSPEEILLAMRDRNLSAKQAARSIHNARLERASKKTVKHPSTVSKSGTGGTNPIDEPYKGTESIKKFLMQRLAERSGKAD